MLRMNTFEPSAHWHDRQHPTRSYTHPSVELYPTSATIEGKIVEYDRVGKGVAFCERANSVRSLPLFDGIAHHARTGTNSLSSLVDLGSFLIDAALAPTAGHRKSVFAHCAITFEFRALAPGPLELAVVLDQDRAAHASAHASLYASIVDVDRLERTHRRIPALGDRNSQRRLSLPWHGDSLGVLSLSLSLVFEGKRDATSAAHIDAQFSLNRIVPS
ncbi:MAG: hypothetical protein AAF493_01100 [Pseudomonadota bacterium]